MPVPEVTVIRNLDGSYSSELGTSVEVAELNNGQPTLIPLIVAGKKLSIKEATQYAITSGLQFPPFPSNDAATAHSIWRSKTGGAVTHGFLGREPQRSIMPHKEPLTRATKKWHGGPAGDVELTDRAKNKLRGQISRAERIMRVETPQSKGWHKGLELKNRAQKLLGAKGSSPRKSASGGGDKYQKRREPIEKATGVHKMRKALEAVGKTAQKRNGG